MTLQGHSLKLGTMATGLATVYRKAFWHCYDNIGRLILLNLMWFCLSVLPAYIVFKFAPLSGILRLVMTFACAIGGYSFSAMALFSTVSSIVGKKPARLKQFFSEGKSLFTRGLVASALTAVLLFACLLSIRFYLNLKGYAAIAGFFAVGLQVWILLFVAAMRIYLVPILATYRWSLWKAIKWSAILVILKPGTSALVLVQAVAFMIIVSATILGAALVAYSLTAVFLTVNLQETMKELEEKWKPKRKPTSWKEIFAQRQLEEEERSLRDILKPWE